MANNKRELEQINMKKENYNNYNKIEWVHFAIQEAINGNSEELNKALELIEDIRENYFNYEKEKTNK